MSDERHTQPAFNQRLRLIRSTVALDLGEGARQQRIALFRFT